MVYTYLRVIEDHAQPNLAAFLEKEVTFVITLIREWFNDVLMIGGDLSAIFTGLR